MLPEVKLGSVEIPDGNPRHVLGGLHVYHHLLDAIGVLLEHRLGNFRTPLTTNREIKVEVEAEALLSSDDLAGYRGLRPGLAELRIGPEEEG